MMKFLGVFLILAICSAYGHPVERDDSDATCTDVTTKMVAFIQAAMGRSAPMMSSTIESFSGGIQILNAPYLEQFTCPWFESESIADVGEVIRSTGLLRMNVGSLLAYGSLMYSDLSQTIANGGLEEEIQYNTPAVRELLRAIIEMAGHLGDMGYMNLNPEGFARMQVFVSNMLMRDDPLQPFVGNPSAYTTSRKQEILLQDMQVIVNKAQAAAGNHWPMVVMMVNLYSGGLVDFNNMESVNSLVRAVADMDSLDDLYEFVSSSFLMPLLNFFYPQLDHVLSQHGRETAEHVTMMEEWFEEGHVPQESVDRVTLEAATFAAFHDAIRATGVLNLH